MRGRAHFPYLLLRDVLVGLVLLAHLAFASDIPQRESTPGLGEPAESVRFQLYQGYLIVVHGSIGAVKNLNIFLDTGATPALLDSRVARKLNLRGEESVSIVRLDRRTRAEETTVPSLEIGPLKCSNLRVVTADLSFYEKVLPVRIDAIVGLDVLGQRPFVIDYPARSHARASSLRHGSRFHGSVQQGHTAEHRNKRHRRVEEDSGLRGEKGLAAYSPARRGGVRAEAGSADSQPQTLSARR
jgi:hypothetical protein